MADTILFNANVITMDRSHPRARFVAIRDGLIITVCGDDGQEALPHQVSKRIDCQGKTVLPGFIDPHCHIHSLAERLVSLNVEPADNIQSIPDIQQKIKDLRVEMTMIGGEMAWERSLNR